MAEAKTKQYYVANGFNIGCTADEPNGKRYDAGEKTANIVDPKDFDKSVWSDLVSSGAIAEVSGELK